jgi:hypothetical protein
MAILYALRIDFVAFACVLATLTGCAPMALEKSQIKTKQIDISINSENIRIDFEYVDLREIKRSKSEAYALGLICLNYVNANFGKNSSSVEVERLNKIKAHGVLLIEKAASNYHPGACELLAQLSEREDNATFWRLEALFLGCKTSSQILNACNSRDNRENIAYFRNILKESNRFPWPFWRIGHFFTRAIFYDAFLFGEIEDTGAGIIPLYKSLSDETQYISSQVDFENRNFYTAEIDFYPPILWNLLQKDSKIFNIKKLQSSLSPFLSSNGYFLEVPKVREKEFDRFNINIPKRYTNFLKDYGYGKDIFNSKRTFRRNRSVKESELSKELIEKNRKKAVKELTDLALRGNASAEYYLGVSLLLHSKFVLEKGTSLATEKEEEGLRWIQSAARKEHPGALEIQAQFTKDTKTRWQLRKKAAQLGCVTSFSFYRLILEHSLAGDALLTSFPIFKDEADIYDLITFSWLEAFYDITWNGLLQVEDKNGWPDLAFNPLYRDFLRFRYRNFLKEAEKIDDSSCRNAAIRYYNSAKKELGYFELLPPVFVFDIRETERNLEKFLTQKGLKDGDDVFIEHIWFVKKEYGSDP